MEPPYTRPQLVIYGDIQEITRSAPKGTDHDSHMGNPDMTG
jgi:hypothetical protein